MHRPSYGRRQLPARPFETTTTGRLAAVPAHLDWCTYLDCEGGQNQLIPLPEDPFLMAAYPSEQLFGLL